MIEGWRRLVPRPRAVVALAHESLRPLVAPALPEGLGASSGETWDLVAAADLALVASGSATLETALLGTPMIIMYRLSALSYAIARRLVRVPFIGMPNLILGKAAVPELIQDEVDAERIAAEAGGILADPERRARMRADLARVRDALGTPGAAARAAQIAARMLGRTPVATGPSASVSS
jgi:lipid-A-disaccharide synthase